MAAIADPPSPMSHAHHALMPVSGHSFNTRTPVRVAMTHAPDTGLLEESPPGPDGRNRYEQG